MTDERICTKCGKGGVPPRCRVHEGCLSYGATAGKSTPAAPNVEAHMWFDDDLGRFRWSEGVWMEAACGQPVHTVETAGHPHDCGEDGCRLKRLAPVQLEHTDQIDWDQVDMFHVLPESPSTFEAGFPEVFFRARGKSDETDEDREVRIESHRKLEMERLDRVLNILPTQDVTWVLGAVRDVPVAERATAALRRARQVVGGAR
jgi:hypothetical protein